jgi:hypothetical protein
MNQSAYAISATLPTDGTISSLLSGIDDAIGRGNRHLLRLNHSARYVGQMLTGEKPLPLSVFVNALTFIYARGERQNIGVGKERVRRILQTIARPFGLDVVPTSDTPTKDIRAEVIEAAGACGRTFDAVHRAIADDTITPEERAEIEADVQNAKAQLDDVLKVLR